MAISPTYPAITPYMFVRALIDQQLQEQVATGIEALVTMYYLNYTEATELDPQFVGALYTLAYHTGYEVDDEFVNECIRKAEAEFEDDPQNPPRTVRTASVQEEEDVD